MEDQSRVAFVTLLFWPAWLLLQCCFLLTLQKALKKCAPESRTITPGKVWLNLIPIFGFIWQFKVVINVAKSLAIEFARLKLAYPDRTLGRPIGLAMCTCTLYVFIPQASEPLRLLRDLIGCAYLPLLIMYWYRIAQYGKLLDAQGVIAPAVSAT